MKRRICLGKIVAAHGIKGEVKFKCYTCLPVADKNFFTVENQEADKKFQIKVVGQISSNVRIKIKDKTTVSESYVPPH